MTMFPNLAVFENIVHIGANPPYIGFIQRPILKDFSHTYHNIIQTGVYTLNHVHKDFVENAHYTSAKFAADVSEFEACGLTMEMQEGFKAPFVAESKIKMGLRFVQEIPITLNDTKLIIGQVEHVYVQKSALMDDGRLQLNAVDDVCASGLDMYHEVKMIAEYPYAKADSIPDISK